MLAWLIFSNKQSTATTATAQIIQDALGLESDDVANYCFPKTWPTDPEQRARIIGEWLQTEARRKCWIVSTRS